MILFRAILFSALLMFVGFGALVLILDPDILRELLP